MAYQSLVTLTGVELQNHLKTALRELRSIDSKERTEPAEPAKPYDGNRKISTPKLILDVIIGAVFFGAIGAAVACFFFNKSQFSWSTAMVGFIPGVVLYFPVVIIWTKSWRAKAPKVEAEYKQWQIDHESWKNEFSDLLQGATALHVIPSKYCNELALEFMLDLVGCGRAETWTQCADKFEEQLHRWQVEENSAEAARYAKNASRAAAWAAWGAWRS